MSRKINFILILLSLFSSLALASKTTFEIEKHIVVTPLCLINQITHHYTTLASNQNLSLIEIDSNGIRQLIRVNTHQKQLCGGFIDVTDEWLTVNSKKSAPQQAKLFLMQYDMPLHTKSENVTFSIKYQKQVNPLLNQINPQDMWQNLTTLTSFPDRFAFSTNGVNAAEWIKNKMLALAQQTGHTDVKVYFIDTGRYRQPSVVAKLGHSDEPGIVIGGHMDSILEQAYGRSPGADDDGSGSVAVMEVARTLLSSGMHFKKPIYFIWYAAEEMGLVGSKKVVAKFKEKNIPIEAVIQLDLAGYAPKNDPTLWLISDYVNSDLTAYLALLIDTYIKQPVKYTKCGYACSDHASWHKAGIIASMPVEAEFGKEDPYIHTIKDTMDILSLAHMTDFVKLGVAFGVELAEPVT